MTTISLQPYHHNQIVVRDQPGSVKYSCDRSYVYKKAAADSTPHYIFQGMARDYESANVATPLLRDTVVRIKEFWLNADVTESLSAAENAHSFNCNIFIGVGSAPANMNDTPAFDTVLYTCVDNVTNIHDMHMKFGDLPPIVVPYGKCLMYSIYLQNVYAETNTASSDVYFSVHYVYETPI